METEGSVFGPLLKTRQVFDVMDNRYEIMLWSDAGKCYRSNLRPRPARR